jgi:hypothetical protein
LEGGCPEFCNDWQFREIVDALQLLLVDLAQCPSAREVEWDFLRESGASLGANHPTVAAASTSERVIDAVPVYGKSSTQQRDFYPLSYQLRPEGDVFLIVVVVVVVIVVAIE